MKSLRTGLFVLSFILSVGLASACGRPTDQRGGGGAPPLREDTPTGNETAGTAGRAPATAEPRGPSSAADERSVVEKVKDLVTPGPAYRDITIPAGTVLPLVLRSSVGSDTSRVEDTVRAETRAPIVINGVQAIPAGSTVLGSVTSARRSARVKGRASVAFRFHTVEARDERYQISTGVVARRAPGTKKRDAATIGIPAAGGAIIGGVAGGKKGAAIGGAVGGGAGTAAVLSTRGKEVRFGPGARLSVRLTRPVTVRVPR